MSSVRMHVPKRAERKPARMRMFVLMGALFGLIATMGVVTAPSAVALANEEFEDPAWPLTLPSAQICVGGQVTLSEAQKKEAFAAGERVELQVSPLDGWHGCALTITNEITGETLPFEGSTTGGGVSFVMPNAPVKVKADFGYGEVAPSSRAELPTTPAEGIAAELGVEVAQPGEFSVLSLFDGAAQEGEAKPTETFVEVEHWAFDKGAVSAGLSREQFEAPSSPQTEELESHALGSISGDVLLYDVGDPQWYVAFVHPLASDVECVDQWSYEKTGELGDAAIRANSQGVAVAYDETSGLLKVSKAIDELSGSKALSVVLLETSDKVATTPVDSVIHVEGDGLVPPELATDGCTITMTALAAPLVEMKIAEPGVLGDAMTFEDFSFFDADGNQVFTEEPVAGVLDYDDSTGMLRVAGLSPAFYRELTIKVRRHVDPLVKALSNGSERSDLGAIWPEYDGARFVERMQNLEATYREFVNQGLVDYGEFYSTYGADTCYLGTSYNSGSMEGRAQGPGRGMDCSSFMAFAMVQEGAEGNWDSWSGLLEYGPYWQYTFGKPLPSTTGLVSVFDHYATQGRDVPELGHVTLDTIVITGRGDTARERAQDAAAQLLAASYEDGGEVFKGAPCIWANNADFDNGPGGAISDCHALFWWPEPERPDGQAGEEGCDCFWNQNAEWSHGGQTCSNGTAIYLGRQNCLSQLYGKSTARYLYTVRTQEPKQRFANVALTLDVGLDPHAAELYSLEGAEFVVSGPDAQNANEPREWRFTVTLQPDGSFGFSSAGNADAELRFGLGETYTVKQVTFPQGMVEDPELSAGWSFTIPQDQRTDEPYRIAAPNGLPVVYNEPSESGEEGDPLTIYRLYNEYSGEHLWTMNASEYHDLQDEDWTPEGEAFSVRTRGTKVYRLFNPYLTEGSAHHYTTDLQEAVTCVSAGWRYEGIAWMSGGEVPVYRLYNPYDAKRLWTADYNEYQALGKLGWQQEGVGFEAVG